MCCPCEQTEQNKQTKNKSTKQEKTHSKKTHTFGCCLIQSTTAVHAYKLAKKAGYNSKMPCKDSNQHLKF